ncbi:MAG: Rne/Rng family ribonuclease [Bacteroidota bacterium]
MEKELIINNTAKGVDVALLENKKLVELHQDKNNNQFNVGDIFLGRIKKIIPGLNAVFVDIGSEKDAFLHYSDLSPQIHTLNRVIRNAVAGNYSELAHLDLENEREIHKDGKIADVLKQKDLVLVQILKEPISSKGPRLSCEISLASRNLILSPFDNNVGVSKKIANAEERKRLKVLVESLKSKNFSIVVRTLAEGKTASALHEEIIGLNESWKNILIQLKGAVAPAKIYSEQNKANSILRDLLNDSFSRIVSNNALISKDIEEYVVKIAPDKKNIVSYFGEKGQIFDEYGITKQIKSSFGKTVSMDGGGYLVIEHTEALHVIDVNSGHKVSTTGNQESIALSVNTEAAREVARQLRLRDMGGIIVIDFIDMKLAANRLAIYDLMKEEMQRDRAKHSIQPLTKLNLMQITRERVKPQINITTNESCPSCNGTGKVDSTVLVTDEIYKNIKYLLGFHKKLSLEMHPYVYAFLTKGLWSIQAQWWWKHKKWIKMEANNNLALMHFIIYDERNEEIKIN